MQPHPSIPYFRTLDVRDRCLCLQAQRAARALARAFDRAFQPLDLTNGQFSLLMALNRPQPPIISQLARELAMDRTTVTAMVKVLERRGLLDASHPAGNRRSLALSLTMRGQDLLLAALPLWEQTLAKIREAMPVEAPDLASSTLALLAKAGAPADSGART